MGEIIIPIFIELLCKVNGLIPLNYVHKYWLNNKGSISLAIIRDSG